MGLDGSGSGYDAVILGDFKNSTFDRTHSIVTDPVMCSNVAFRCWFCSFLVKLRPIDGVSLM